MNVLYLAVRSNGREGAMSLFCKMVTSEGASLRTTSFISSQ